VVAGLCFLPFLFLSPLLSLVPAIATAPALILVGVFMIESITRIDWHRFDEAVPAFVAILLIPLTYSITDGVAYGFLAYVLIKLATGRAREVKLAMWVIAALAILLLAHL
jgi:adenine/guanine/hypoxanthine permease